MLDFLTMEVFQYRVDIMMRDRVMLLAPKIVRYVIKELNIR